MRPPEILIPGKINDINTYILEKTGCFAFLTSDNCWTYSEPKTGKGAVELWSIALYTIYHDYGCKFIRFILDECNKPNDSIDEMLWKSRRHITIVQRVLRSNVAHGTLDTYTPDELKRIFFARERKTLKDMPEEQWFRVAEIIRRESNDLVESLYKWADGFQSDSSIRNRFGASDDFKKSIDSRIMFETLDNDFCKNREKRAKRILEDQSKELPAAKIDTWRNEISRMFLNNEIKTPQEIIDKLKSFLFEVHQPVQRSSITIGESLGFSLSDLLK